MVARSIYVRNVPGDASPDDLLPHFEPFGTVKDVYIPRSFYNNQPRGFAYVKFDLQEDADAAMEKIQQIELRGEIMTIEWATGERKSSQEMRSYDSR
eukprot:jgi/Hompol1/4020/HPOL_006880-RA